MTKILGYEFVEMTKRDWDGYAGAEEGTLICRLPDRDLLYDPKSGVLSEISATEDDGVVHQTDWTPSKVI